MSYIEETKAAGRHVFPDLVRAFALFGIVLVNVAYLAYPGELTYHYGSGLGSGLDEAAYFGINSLFLFKSYTLFSFMFGAGLAYQMMSAERRGTKFGGEYFRRMLGLILLGVLHVTLAFVGDILIIYGVVGMLLFLFRNKSAKSLIRWGMGFVIFQVFLALLMASGMWAFENFDPDEFATMATEMMTMSDSAAEVYSNGSFTEVVARRWTDWAGYIAFASPMQAPGVLGFFLLGLAGVKSGVMSNPDALIWARARKVFLPIGLIISVIGAWIYTHAEPVSAKGMLGMAIILVGSPFSSFGYLGWIAKWSTGAMSGVKEFMARAGTSTLTAYLLQSLLLSLVFCGYGLGMFGQIGAAGCIAIAFLVGIITLSFSSLWRTKFKRGPMEYLLRGWTYLGKS